MENTEPEERRILQIMGNMSFCLFFVSYMIPALFAILHFGPMAIIFYTMLAMITICGNLVQKDKNEHAC